MDDPAFPDSHYTSTTTATTTTTTVQSPPLKVDIGYVKSIPGILRIVQILLNLMALIMIAVCVFWNGYPIFVCVTAMVFTIFLFILFLIHLDKRITVINWPATDLINNIIWSIQHFISACILAARAANRWYWYNYYHGCAAFTAVLGFALFILYGVSTFFSFRQFQAGGGLSQLRGRGGQSATATTVTTSTTQQGPPPPYPEEK
ncbi:plasmolipin-like isoform X2 [Acanthaster planci]|uniref:Plasmolipin-like isoform X2 n=1 Tax=Acanthaster planci TaxID=133434 RepID=A0A8B7YHS0_ACAPL|nr:plasmolipin-like isoform X2 [Acanthaster planci]